jgi:alginate O-acetyltransferase complex protein AlgJ
MVTNAQPAPTREEIAQREIGHTDVAPGTVRFLLVFFLLALCAVPAFELVSGRAAAVAGNEPPWAHLTRLPEEISARVSTDAADAGPWKELLIGNRTVVQALIAFENALEDESRLAHILRPPTQKLMTAWLGAGNERAYVGREGWLFYRPDVEYLTGVGFLDPAYMNRRVDGVDQWTTPPQPDPRKAIVHFNRQLADRGIALIVMPVPVKPGIHPEQLSSRYADAGLPLQNRSYDTFLADLRREGVIVFDAAAVLADAVRASQATQYLATDTHWRPEAMEAVASSLAALVRSRVSLPEAAAGYRTEPQETRQLGDIAVMLDLPSKQILYPPETIAIRRVLAPDGTPWRPSRAADVLVLGDSFSNIYSLPTMGWGDAAGFVEHVSYALQRPVDRIVQNDNGAYATRELLRRGGDERLSGKRLVIYQFAARELMFGDWRMFE